MTTIDRQTVADFKLWLATRPKPPTTGTLSTWFSRQFINLVTDRLDIAIEAGASDDVQELIKRAFQ